MGKVFKIWNKKTNAYNGSYSRAYHDEYEFDSEESAIEANCHGVFHDTDTYEIHEVEITEKLVKKLPPKESYVEETAEKAKRQKEIDDFMKEHPKATPMQAIMHTSILGCMKNN